MPRSFTAQVIRTAVVIGTCAGLSTAHAAEVSFRNDVMAVLSKSGCNAGVCHGNKNGKGGFLLSLRGENPKHDFEALTRAHSGRRINVQQPPRSLVLRKATLDVAHGGGKRIAENSLEYRILEEWLAGGARDDAAEAPRVVELDVIPRSQVLTEPQDHLALTVRARFEDGSVRDVSRLAVYAASEPIVRIAADGVIHRETFGETVVTVRYLQLQRAVRLAFVPQRPEFAARAPEPANFIDEHVFAKLKTLRINPSPVAEDSVFLRRAYFDLIGVPPTADEARAFLADSSPDKRVRLIDALLERPEFADFWAQKWSDLLRNEEKTLDRKGVENFYHWIRQRVARNIPWDEFVRELITSRGSTYTSPAANFYRAMRDPVTRAESTAQLFLGVRLQCAKCHNHPFDRWTQDDYYNWANVFARVDYKIVENLRRDRNDKHEFVGEQIVFMKSDGDVVNARTGEPAEPRFLGADADRDQPRGDRLTSLAAWLTSTENTRFVQSQANRVWFHLMGRGIVDPIDDFRATNPPVNPELLDALAADFAAGGFDLKQLIRRIMNSKTYQLSAEPTAGNAGDDRNFSHALVRRLPAEQLIDAVSQVLGVDVAFNGYPAGTRAGEIPGVRAVRFRDQPASRGDRFLTLFGKPPRLQPCECERPVESTLNQTFELISGPLLNELLTRDDNRLPHALAAGAAESQGIEELYLHALSRPPSSDELERVTGYLQSQPDRRRAWEDVAWALLNSNEFLLRR